MRTRAAAGVLLLALTAHAFVASATHFHGLTEPGGRPTHAALQGSDGGGRSLPLAGEDARCLLCRLQRNLISGLQNVSLVVVSPTSVGLDYEELQKNSPRNTCPLLRQGRAPPPV